MTTARRGGDQAQLRRRLEAAEALAGVGSWSVDAESRVTCSPAFLRIHGFAPDEDPADLAAVLAKIESADRERVGNAVAESLASGRSYRVEYHVSRPGRIERVVRAEGTVMHEAGGSTRLCGAVLDVTESEFAASRLIAAESRYAAVIEHANDGIWILDGDGRTVFVNRRMSEMLEYPAGEVLGRAPLEFAPGQGLELLNERRAHFECRYQRKSGEDLWTTNAMSRLPAASGGGAVLLVTDITARKQMEERLRNAAERDPLTGLMNRARLELLLDGLIGNGAPATEPLALLFLDLDYFKYVNDSFGHSVGDALLREVAECLAGLVRDEDIVARFAGDEFVIVLPGVGEQVATTVAKRFVEVIRSRRWQTLSRITASVGVAVAEPARPTTRAELLVAADSALHDAKSNGRDQVAAYSGQGGGGFKWVDEIHAALAEDRLVLHGQAIVSLTGASERRYELLIRMLARDGSLVPPGTFIPAAEQFGIMPEIDRWVVDRAIERAAGGMSVEVNLSGASLGDHDIRARVEAAVAAGVDPKRLTFEVTETAAARNIDAAKSFADQLERLGCSFALDDFGTGFGSLIYLKHLPVSQLKIDIEFVRDLVHNDADRRLVRAIVQMAEPLGLETVAEGVEDAETLSLLRELGVGFAQGFWIDRPSLLDLPRSVDGNHLATEVRER